MTCFVVLQALASSLVKFFLVVNVLVACIQMLRPYELVVSARPIPYRLEPKHRSLINTATVLLVILAACLKYKLTRLANVIRESVSCTALNSNFSKPIQ